MIKKDYMSKRLSDLNLAFASPIWTSLIVNYKDINSRMLEYINLLKSQDPKGKYKSNMIGWHSDNFDLKKEEVIFFINSISKNLNQTFQDMGWDTANNEIKITNMWSIINYKNSFNARHIHPNNYISAAYYVKAPKNSGNIVFYDPRSENVIRTPIISKTNKLNSNVFSVEVQEGLLVLFPSYLHHSVDINKSEKERIVISFNIDLRNK